MKKGDVVTMCFCFAGVTSEAEVLVTRVTKNFIEIDDWVTPDGKNDDERARFDPKTGRCLNENTSFGANRIIKLIEKRQ